MFLKFGFLCLISHTWWLALIEKKYNSKKVTCIVCALKMIHKSFRLHGSVSMPSLYSWIVLVNGWLAGWLAGSKMLLKRLLCVCVSVMLLIIVLSNHYYLKCWITMSYGMVGRRRGKGEMAVREIDIWREKAKRNYILKRLHRERECRWDLWMWCPIGRKWANAAAQRIMRIQKFGSWSCRPHAGGWAHQCESLLETCPSDVDEVLPRNSSDSGGMKKK